MPILHFSGNFKTQPPIYNNTPYNIEKYFDNTDPETVQKKITEGVEPVEYFEFKFDNVYIRKVTYDDGISINDKEKDAVIGKRLMLKGLLVDTAPHLERSRLYAGEVRVVDLMIGKLEQGFESDLFTTIRRDETEEDRKEPALKFSADIECKIYDMQSLAGDFISTENSRYFSECDLASKDFKIYFHLSKFYYSKLEGEVHGYIGLYVPELDDRRVRIHGRRLLIDPGIKDELKKDFKLESYHRESNEVLRNDLEGTYEILIDQKLVILRFLNFISYLDTNNNTPPGYTFFVKLFDNGNEIKSQLPREIKVDRKSVFNSGGIFVVQFPENIADLSALSMSVTIKKHNENTQCFMKEPEYDLIINNNQKYLVLESKKKEELEIKVYQKNFPLKDKNIRVILETHRNDRSPIVARWTSTEVISDKDSLLTCYVQAHDLEHSKEIEDVIIIGVDEENKIKRGKLFGDLPWDRYYGNYLSVKIDNDSIIFSNNNNDNDDNNKKEPTIKFNIPVRVLHSVRLDELESDIDNLNKEKIQEVINKILSYYVRYYPWLHTQYVYQSMPPKTTKLAYVQFLKIREFLIYVGSDDIGNWGLVQSCVNNINHLLDRLTKEDSDWKKMPRSRDFPFNGVEFLKMYKASIIDNMIKAVIDEQDKNIESEGKSDDDVEIDMDNWTQIRTLLDNLGDMTSRLSDDDKRLITIWKLQIYDNLIHNLNVAKTQTKHVHKHG